MSNQNLNTLNVETLNFTGSNIYHRGRPIQSFPIDASGAGHGGMLCLDHLGVGPTAPPCPNPLYNLDVSGATRINGALDLSSVDITINAVLTGNIDANLTNSTVGLTNSTVGLTSSTLDISGIGTTVDISGITTLNTKTIIRGILDASGLNVHKYFGGPMYDSKGIWANINHQTPVSTAGGWEWMDVSGNTVNTSLWHVSPFPITNAIYFDASGNPGLGKVGIDTQDPRTSLDVSGTITCNQLDVSGSNFKNQIGSFSSGKGATVPYSTAIGFNCLASHTYSTAMGQTATASNTSSTAMGCNTTASGTVSTAMGENTTASGTASTAMGYGTTASEAQSTAMGNATVASGQNSTAMGIYSNASTNFSTAIGNRAFAGGPSGIQFAVGSSSVNPPSIATSSSNNNKFVILNTGNVGIGMDNPATTLDVSGNVKIRGYLDMSCNRIIDISGISFCSDASGIDMSCNPITDVSGIYFCDGSAFTHGNSLDISASTVHITNTNLIVDGSGLIQTLTVGLGGGAIPSNTVVGYQALQTNTAGTNNVALGYGALQTSDTSYNTAVGYGALLANTGDQNTAIGAGALGSNIGTANVATGYDALGFNTGTNNVATGYAALADNRGDENTAIGTFALQSNKTGESNVATGYNALNLNETGNNNVAIGAQALQDNSGGSGNVAIGNSALFSNTDGNYNVATGSQALYYNTTGVNNVATGDGALFTNTIGNRNVAYGNNALYLNETGNYNVATSSQALYSNTTGNNNVATGYAALYTNTIGGSNVATGYGALYKNIDGSSNVAIGYNTLYYNTANENVAIGAQALQANTTGFNNVATGYNALLSNQTGNNNVATGYTALPYSNGSNNVAIGTSALYQNSAGGNNVAVGMQAMHDNDASYNTAIGYEAGKGQTDISNTINVGYDASCNASNTACIGNADISCVYLGSINGNAKLDCSGIVSSGLVETTDISCSMISAGGNVGNNNQVLSITGGIIEWVDGTSVGSHWTTDGGVGIHNTSGNVGIGKDSSINFALDVSGNMAVSSGIVTTGDIDMSCNSIRDVSGIYFCDGSSFTHGDSLDISGDGISFLTNGTEQMKILSTGQVGIGVSNPTIKLEVTDISCSKLYAGGVPGSSGQVLSSTGTGIQWVDGTTGDQGGSYFATTSTTTTTTSASLYPTDASCVIVTVDNISTQLIFLPSTDISGAKIKIIFACNGPLTDAHGASTTDIAVYASQDRSITFVGYQWIIDISNNKNHVFSQTDALPTAGGTAVSNPDTFQFRGKGGGFIELSGIDNTHWFIEANCTYIDWELTQNQSPFYAYGTT